LGLGQPDRAAAAEAGLGVLPFLNSPPQWAVGYEAPSRRRRRLQQVREGTAGTGPRTFRRLRRPALEEMPLNPTGKIDRSGLKQLAEDHLHPHGLS
jgi:hypothetical protein